MTRGQIYAWVVAAIGCIVVATAIPYALLVHQTREIKHLARVAVCVSLAEQQRLHPDHPRLNLSQGCFGLTGPEILREFQSEGDDIAK